MMPGAIDLETMSEETGIPARTIRSYISRGLVPKPFRPGRGATYPPEALNRLKFVQILLSRGLGLDLIEEAMNAVTDDDISAVVDDGEELRLGLLENQTQSMRRALDPPSPTDSRTLSRLTHALRAFSRPATPRRTAETWIRAKVTDDMEIAVRTNPTGHARLQVDEVASLLRRLIDHGRK